MAVPVTAQEGFQNLPHPTTTEQTYLLCKPQRTTSRHLGAYLLPKAHPGGTGRGELKPPSQILVQEGSICPLFPLHCPDSLESRRPDLPPTKTCVIHKNANLGGCSEHMYPRCFRIGTPALSDLTTAGPSLLTSWHVSQAFSWSVFSSANLGGGL